VPIGGTEQHRARQRARPQCRSVEQIASALELREERLPCPEGREERHHRRLKIRKEVGDIGKRFDTQQPLRLDEPKNQDERCCKQQTDEHQHVAGTPCRQHVHQQQCRARAERHRNRRKRHHGQQGGEIVGEGSASRDANADQHWRQKHRNHP
jgi:hypothetical protein